MISDQIEFRHVISETGPASQNSKRVLKVTHHCIGFENRRPLPKKPNTKKKLKLNGSIKNQEAKNEDVMQHNVTEEPKKNDTKSNTRAKDEDSALNDSHNINRFAETKIFIQTIADVSLLMANFSQLRAVLDFKEHNKFFISLLTFIIISLLSHIFFVIITVMRTNFNNRHLITVERARKDTTQQGKVRYCLCCTKKERRDEYVDTGLCQCRHCHTNRYLNYVCMILVFVTICANIGITGIGISE
ncbi:unnamed protein product [Mytilus edulis]|uniref:Uncharacterized protein n=1 Tax=Mytilus edulis TaxID=6550 RepID=A0A8S3RUW0_MYTED|nr:unnamed protein product [Mytilus edulis]